MWCGVERARRRRVIEGAVAVRCRARFPMQAFACSILTTVAACGSGPMEPSAADLRDGEYTVRLSAPVLVNEFITPSWMTEEPVIDYVKNGNALAVRVASESLVPIGAVQRFARIGDAWVVHFAWRPKQDGNHYWRVTFDGNGCIGASAVDADLFGSGADGVWTVDLEDCVIEMQ
jgi:hypothetical protein